MALSMLLPCSLSHSHDCIHFHSDMSVWSFTSTAMGPKNNQRMYVSYSRQSDHTHAFAPFERRSVVSDKVDALLVTKLLEQKHVQVGLDESQKRLHDQRGVNHNRDVLLHNRAKQSPTARSKPATTITQYMVLLFMITCASQVHTERARCMRS